MIRPRPPRRRRAGVTMVELLVVIAIISILMAVLVPVIIGAVRTAREAVVAGEINQMSAALANFQSTYNELPPSRIILFEDGNYFNQGIAPGTALSGLPWLGASPQSAFSPVDLDYTTLAQRSVLYLNKFFPRAQYIGQGIPAAMLPPPNTPHPTSGVWYDFNGNGQYDPHPIYLEGHECLVFFLGGIPSISQASPADPPIFGATGFSKNPINPFVNATMATNRIAPSFSGFKSERLIDSDGDGIPGYTDGLEKPNGALVLGDARYYAYFRSYGGGNYDPNDMNIAEPDTNNTTPAIMRAFQVQFTGMGAPVPNVAFSFAPNPYTSTLPIYTNAPQPVTYQAPETYQIISAGRDLLYGIGGQYAPNGNDKLPFPDAPTANVPANIHAQALDGGIRNREQDNITSFKGGRLD